MIVRLAYHDSTIAICRKHYDAPLKGTPPLGPVEDARNSGCDTCRTLWNGHAVRARACWTRRWPSASRIAGATCATSGWRWSQPSVAPRRGLATSIGSRRAPSPASSSSTLTVSSRSESPRAPMGPRHNGHRGRRTSRPSARVRVRRARQAAHRAPRVAAAWTRTRVGPARALCVPRHRAADGAACVQGPRTDCARATGP